MPLAGLHTTDLIPDASDAVVVILTIAPKPELVNWNQKRFPRELVPGQVMVGLAASVTTTLKVHDAKLSLLSVALQVTTVVPKGKSEPLVALHPLDLIPDASVGDTLYVTIVRALPPDVTLVGLVVGHPGFGGVTSVVLIAKAQLDVRFALSVFVHPTYTS